jgi:hypothetical protein
MPKRDFGMVSTNSLEILESPLALLPGMEPVFSVVIAGSGVIDTPTMKLYKGTKDVSSTNLSGSMTVSGRSILCKKIISLTPGDWVFYISFNDGGSATKRFCRFSVAKEGAS